MAKSFSIFGQYLGFFVVCLFNFWYIRVLQIQFADMAIQEKDFAF